MATVPKTKSRKGSPRKGSHRLVLPVGDPDTSAVRAFMLECLVPLLAEEFLKRRAAALSPPLSTMPRKSTFEALGKEGGL
jgi:hypothetical protein